MRNNRINNYVAAGMLLFAISQLATRLIPMPDGAIEFARGAASGGSLLLFALGFMPKLHAKLRGFKKSLVSRAK